MDEFRQARLLPDSEAVQETVEIGLNFERAAKTEEDRHNGLMRRLPKVPDFAIPVPTGSMFSEKK